ncbi:hypothetical protein RJ639_015677 [Escallonia herrerae]|uniref:TIP49 P-loop domain-containing protein n=1 Tax=Escallonia herrerae TaxID=1293975 RepID=A0AA88VCV0_9ASTE|nr:hypothetical protein RJ639_015677 [Escallonia herrerae]
MDILAKEFNEFLKIKKVGNPHKSKNDSSVDITSWENKKKKGSRKKHSMKTSIEAIIYSDDDSNGDEGGHFDEGDANLCFMARKDDEAKGKALPLATAFVGQAAAREAGGLIVDMICQKKMAGRVLLLTRPLALEGSPRTWYFLRAW